MCAGELDKEVKCTLGGRWISERNSGKWEPRSGLERSSAAPLLASQDIREQVIRGARGFAEYA